MSPLAHRKGNITYHLEEDLEAKFRRRNSNFDFTKITLEDIGGCDYKPEYLDDPNELLAIIGLGGYKTEMHH